MALRYVNYGDVIVLRSADEKEAANFGYINGDGIVNKESKLWVDRLDPKCRVSPNPYDACFEVVRKQNYSQEKALNKELMLLGRTVDEIGHLGADDKKLEALVQARDKEREKNKLENELVRGEYITFGTVIQLRHISSGRFLTVGKTRAEREPKMMSVSLRDEGDEGSWLRVGLGYKAQTEGDKVRCDDDITLESVKNEARYIHVSEKITDFNNSEAKKKHLRPEMEDYLDRVLSCHEVNCSRNKSRLHVILYRDYTVHYRSHEDDTLGADVVRGGDVVNLNHKEMGGMITYDQANYPGFPVIDTGEDERSNTLWRVEADTMRHGGFPVQFGSQGYRLHHLGTNTFLAAGAMERVKNLIDENTPLPEGWEDIKDTKDSGGLLMTTNFECKGCVWHFMQYQTEVEGFLTTSMFFYLFNAGVDKDYDRKVGFDDQLDLSKANGGYLDAGHQVTRPGLSEPGMDRLVNPEEMAGSKVVLVDKEGDEADDLDEEDDGDVFRLLWAREKHKEDVLTCTITEDTESNYLKGVAGRVMVLVELIEDFHEHRKKFFGQNPQDGEEEHLFEILNAHKHAVLAVLKHWIDELDQNSHSRKDLQNTQNTLGEQDIVHILLTMCTSPFRDRDDDRDHARNILKDTKFAALREIVSQCHLLLRRLCSGHRANQRAVFKKLDTIQSHMGYGVNASATLVDLFRDNFHLLYRIKTSQVVTFGKMIDDSKKPRYVQFLKIICTCNEEAVIRNQNLIVSEILDSRQHKVLMDVDASAGTIKVCDVDREPEKWVDLKVQEQRVSHTFPDNEQAYNSNSLTDEERLCLYHVECIYLLAEVCLGRNRHALDTLVKPITLPKPIGRDMHRIPKFTEMLHIVFDLAPGQQSASHSGAAECIPAVPYSLLAAYAHLLLVFFVDREPYAPQNYVQLTRISGMAAKNNIERRSQFKADNVWKDHPDWKPDFSNLLRRIQAELTHSTWQRDFGTTNGGKWRFMYLKHLLRIQLTLVRFGWYGDRMTMLEGGFNPGQEDLRTEGYKHSLLATLFITLLPILDSSGLKDLEHVDDTATANYECKVVVCNIISQIMDMRLDDRLDKIISRVEKVYEDLPEEARSAFALPNAECANGNPSPEEWAQKLSDDLFEPAKQREADSRGRIMDEVKTLALTKEESKLLESSLLELASVNHRPMQTQALKMIYQLTMEKSRLVQTLSSVQLLVRSGLVAGYHKAIDAHAAIRMQLKWIQGKKDTKRYAESFIVIHEQLDMIIGLITPRKRSAMREFGNAPEVLRRHQEIIVNAGLLDVVWDILEVPLEAIDAENEDIAARKDAGLYGSGGLDVKDVLLRNLFQTCYQFLKLMCHKSEVMQAKVYTRYDLYLKHMGMNGIDAADAITAAVRGNRVLAESIKADVVQHFVHLITEHGRKSRWLVFLMEFVVVNGEPIKRNQDLVLKIVLDDAEKVLDLCGNDPQRSNSATQWEHTHRLDTYDQLLQNNKLVKDDGNGAVHKRLSKIKANDHHHKRASSLLFHATCVELLAKCAIGKSPGTEARLKSMVTWQDCVANVLDVNRVGPNTGVPEYVSCDSEALYTVKAPFLRLLGEVFLNTDLHDHVRDHQFERWWKPAATDEHGRCLVDEFVDEINALTATLTSTEPKGNSPQPYTREQKSLRQRFIAACSRIDPKLNPKFSALAHLALDDADNDRDPAEHLMVLDTDNSGTVSRDEWFSACEQSGIVVQGGISEEDLSQIWDLVDTNKNGVIDIDEMSLFIHGGPMPGQDDTEQWEKQVDYVLGAVIPCLYWFFQKYYRGNEPGPEEAADEIRIYVPESEHQIRKIEAALSRLLAAPRLPGICTDEHKTYLVELVKTLHGEAEVFDNPALKTGQAIAHISMPEIAPQSEQELMGQKPRAMKKRSIQKILYCSRDPELNAKDAEKRAGVELDAVTFLVFWRDILVLLSKTILEEDDLDFNDMREAEYYEIYECAKLFIDHDNKHASKQHIVPKMINLVNTFSAQGSLYEPPDELLVLTLRVLRAVVYYDETEVDVNKQRLALLINPPLEFEGKWLQWCEFKNEDDKESDVDLAMERLERDLAREEFDERMAKDGKTKMDYFAEQQLRIAKYPDVVPMIVNHIAVSDRPLLVEALHFALALLQSDSGNRAVQSIFHEELLKMPVAIQTTFLLRIQSALRQGQADLKQQIKTIKRKTIRQELIESAKTGTGGISMNIDGKDAEERSIMISHLTETAIGDKEPQSKEAADLDLVEAIFSKMHFEERLEVAKKIMNEDVRNELVDAFKDKSYLNTVVYMLTYYNPNKQAGSGRVSGHASGQSASISGWQVCEMLRFLELLCGGEYREFQDYLRVQPGDGVSVDLISETFSFIDIVEDYIDKAISYKVDEPLKWIISGLETIEMSVRGPNDKNVEHIELKSSALVAIVNTVFDSKLNNTGRKRVNRGIPPKESIDFAKAQVRSSMLQLLHSLLDADDVGGLAKKLGTGISWRRVFEALAADFKILHDLGLSHENPATYTMDQMVCDLGSIFSKTPDAAATWDLHFAEDFYRYHKEFAASDADSPSGDKRPADWKDIQFDKEGAVQKCNRIENRVFQAYLLVLRIALESPEAEKALAEWRDQDTDLAVPWDLREEVERYMEKWVRRVEVIRLNGKRPMAQFYRLNKQGALFIHEDEWEVTRKGVFEFQERAEQTMREFLLTTARIDFAVNYRTGVIDKATGFFEMSLQVTQLFTVTLTADVYLTWIINLVVLLFWDPKLESRVPTGVDTSSAPHTWFMPVTTWFYEDLQQVYSSNSREKLRSHFCDSDTIAILMMLLPPLHVISYMLKLYFFMIMEAPAVCHSLHQDEVQETIAEREKEDEEDQYEGDKDEDDGEDSCTTVCGNLCYSTSQKAHEVAVQAASDFSKQISLDDGRAEPNENERYESLSVENLKILLTQSREFTARSFYLLASFAGAFVHPLFFTLHLFDVVLADPTVRLVLKSVTMHYDKLLQTLLLLVICDYAWAVLGYVFAWNWHADYTKTCGTLYQCFLTYLAEGLKSDGISDALRDTMVDDSYPKHIWSQPDLTLVIAWDFAYFVWVVLILVAIVTGVIIDTFGELRDQDNEEKDMLQNNCFVCGLSKDELRDKDCPGGSQDFFEHVKQEHNVYAYVGYFMYLNEKHRSRNTKQPIPMSSLENYVHRCVFNENPSVSFLPIGVAKRTIEPEDESKEAQLREDIVNLNKVLDKIQLLGLHPYE